MRARWVGLLKGPLRWGLAGFLLGAAMALAVFYGFPPEAAGDPARKAPQSGKNPAPLEGAPAPGFALLNLEGEEIRLEDHRGDVVLVNFWATWCGPCRLEMPILEEYSSRHRDQGLQVLGVNFDEPAQDVRAFRDELGITFPLLLDPGGTVQRLYEIRGYPTTFVIDRSGVVRVVHIGVLTDNQLDKYLSEVGVGS